MRGVGVATLNARICFGISGCWCFVCAGLLLWELLLAQRKKRRTRSVGLVAKACVGTVLEYWVYGLIARFGADQSLSQNGYGCRADE